jgi:hypothetical protein
MAYAVGCILSPLRGQKPLALFYPESAERNLTHTLPATVNADAAVNASATVEERRF